jgi:2-octaprenyl-6-methoxyphenol hydroxylase
MTREKPSKTGKFDAIIAGGGLAGLSMAACLGQSGLRALVIERESREKLSARAFDGRTTALAYGSRRILESCGVWQRLAKDAGPIDDIRVKDQHSPRILDFLSRDAGNNPFGYVVDNTLFRLALFERVQEFPSIQLATECAISAISQQNGCADVTTQDGAVYEAPLLIAADGRHSFCRKQAGIKTRNWSYNETALVVTLKHEKPHHNLAIENFYPGGPFAILPMTDNRSGVVWTEKPALAETLLALDEESFVALLAERGGAHLGKIRLASPRMLYPLRFMMADDLWKDRTVLVGEAAHGMHPIAGQGFNLSLRDAAALGELMEAAHAAGTDIGSPTLLQSYEGKRHMDHLTFMTTTDALVKLFSNNVPPIRWARQFGLGLVQHLPPAKKFFSRMAMGLLGEKTDSRAAHNALK